MLECEFPPDSSTCRLHSHTLLLATPMPRSAVWVYRFSCPTSFTYWCITRWETWCRKVITRSVWNPCCLIYYWRSI